MTAPGFEDFVDSLVKQIFSNKRQEQLVVANNIYLYKNIDRQDREYESIKISNQIRRTRTKIKLRLPMEKRNK
jgi:hypothetical protein